MSKINLKKILSFLVLTALIAWFVFYFLKHKNDFLTLFSIDWPWILLLVILAFLFIFASGLFLKVLMREFKIKLNLKEYTSLAVVTTMGNYLTPFYGGMGARAYYLKKKYNFSYSEFFGTLAANYIIVFFIYALIVDILLLIFYKQSHIFNLPVTILFSGIFLFCLLVIVVAPKFNLPKNRWLKNIVTAINCWHKIRKNKKLIFQLCVLTIFNMLIGCFLFYVSFRALNLNVSFIKSLFLSLISALSVLINITPGALGIKEALVVFSANIIGIATPEAILVAILERAAFMVVIFTLGPILGHFLLQNIKSQDKISK